MTSIKKKPPVKPPRKKTKARSVVPALPVISRGQHVDSSPANSDPPVDPASLPVESEQLGDPNSSVDLPDVEAPSESTVSSEIEIEFDVKAEKRTRNEYIRKSKKLRESLRKMDIGHEQRMKNCDAYVASKRAEIDSLYNQIGELNAQVNNANELRKKFEASKKEVQKKIKGYNEMSRRSKLFITLKKPFLISKLPQEIVVMVLRLVFQEEGPTKVDSFTQMLEYVLHPFMHESSGIAGYYAEVLFGENKFEIASASVANKIFSKKMPAVISTWVKRLDIPYPQHGFNMCKHLLSCTKLESLTLRCSFYISRGDMLDESIDGFQHRNSPFTLKMLSSLPITCNVTIIDTDGTFWPDGQEKDAQNARLVAMQKVWDDRDPASTPKKRRARKKSFIPALGPSDADDDDAVDSDGGVDAVESAIESAAESGDAVDDAIEGGDVVEGAIEGDDVIEGGGPVSVVDNGVGRDDAGGNGDNTGDDANAGDDNDSDVDASDDEDISMAILSEFQRVEEED